MICRLLPRPTLGQEAQHGQELAQTQKHNVQLSFCFYFWDAEENHPDRKMTSPQICGIRPLLHSQKYSVIPLGECPRSLQTSPLFSRPQTHFLNHFLFCRKKRVRQERVFSLQTCPPQHPSSSIHTISEGPAQLQSSLLFHPHHPFPSLSARSASFASSLSRCCSQDFS